MSENNKLENDSIVSIGFLYVRQIGTIEEVKPYKIPFQFNPEITEGAITAKYNATSFLSRIGEMQSYTGTNSLTLSIKTKYTVLALNEGSAEKTSNISSIKRENTIGAWNDFYTLNSINEIENAYRSLVLPEFTSSSEGITYIRPPVIKIILVANEKKEGSYNEKKEDFYNVETEKNQMEFTYPYLKGKDLYDSIGSKNVFLKSQSKEGNLRFHKTFVATSVTINKNTPEAFYIRTDTNTLHYSSFDVDLSLIEVTQDYTDAIPDFKAYYANFNSLISPIVKK